MKVNYMKPVRGFTGKMDGMVYYINKESGVALCREYVVPEESESNRTIKSRSTNLGAFYRAVSDGYISDLKNYCDRFNLMTYGQIPSLNSNSLFIKLMYNLKHGVPSIDLTTITPQFVIDNELPIRTIKEAIDYELLPNVSRSDELVHWII